MERGRRVASPARPEEEPLLHDPAQSDSWLIAPRAAAAAVMAQDPAALQLRLLQTVVEVAGEKNSTLVMPVPVELLRFFDKFTPSAPAGDRKTAEDSASLADFSDDVAAETEITSAAPLEIPEAPQLPVQVSNGKLPTTVVP